MDFGVSDFERKLLIRVITVISGLARRLRHAIMSARKSYYACTSKKRNIANRKRALLMRSSSTNTCARSATTFL